MTEGSGPPGPDPDCVLVDDDPLVHANWRNAAQTHGKSLLAFTNIADFREAMLSIPRHVPIYIDSNLGPGVKGEMEAIQIRDAGFQTIYLCTGFEPGAFRGMSWLTGVLGKDPPWK